MDTATLVSALRVVHIASAILMIWPFYALVAVNQRARLGPPLGDRADVLVENVIKNRTIPCYVFQVTVLLTGLALVSLRGDGLQALVEDPLLGTKFLLLVAVAVSLTYVHLRLQPRIDALFARGGGALLQPDLAQAVGQLRLRRKRMASLCLFGVLTAAMLGVQVAHPFAPGLTVLFIAAIAALTWRSYRSATPFGWF